MPKRTSSPERKVEAMKTYAYGFPGLGRSREYKKIIEDYRALV
jgi:hypothetical protein